MAGLSHNGVISKKCRQLQIIELIVKGIAYARDKRPIQAKINGDNPSDVQTAHAMYRLTLEGQ